jgi:hypothetical protein
MIRGVDRTMDPGVLHFIPGSDLGEIVIPDTIPAPFAAPLRQAA